MATTLRRLFWLALLGGAGYAAWTLYAKRTANPPNLVAPTNGTPPPPQAVAPLATPAVPAPADEAPDAGVDPEDAAREPSASDPAPAPDGAGWVAPDNGTCPLTHPIKANDNSGIYHEPGGRFYERTRAERCYSTAEAATADGYRPAKS